MESFKNFVRHVEQGYTDEEVISIYLHNSNRKIREIAQQTGRSIGELYRILHGNNVEPNRLRTNHRSVLDFAESGMSVTQIAGLTGYTPRNVRYILSKLKME